MCIICSGYYHGKKNIECRYCGYIKNIPVVTGLESLNCGCCYKLKRISIIPGLKNLICCGTKIKSIPNISIL